jgi:hypothetical protein
LGRHGKQGKNKKKRLTFENDFFSVVSSP